MTKQMTMSDRARAASQQKQGSSAEEPVNVNSLDPEKVCQEGEDPKLNTCTTPNDPGLPPQPADEAA